MNTDFNRTEEQPQVSITVAKKDRQSIVVSIGRYFVKLLKLLFFTILFFTLSFHWMPDHGHMFPKEQFSFANTIISYEDVSRLIERHNEGSGFERAVIRQEYLYRKLTERGVIISRDDD